MVGVKIGEFDAIAQTLVPDGGAAVLGSSLVLGIGSGAHDSTGVIVLDNIVYRAR